MIFRSVLWQKPWPWASRSANGCAASPGVRVADFSPCFACSDPVPIAEPSPALWILPIGPCSAASLPIPRPGGYRNHYTPELEVLIGRLYTSEIDQFGYQF